MSKRRDRYLRNKQVLREQNQSHILKKKEAELKKEQVLKPWILSDKEKLDIKIYIKDKSRKDISNYSISDLNIIAYTSLSPSHHNIENQLNAVQSWHKLGLKIYSINHPIEIDILKKAYPDYINFINSVKTTKHIFGKPCILINEMIDHFHENKTGDIQMLINSDIILNITSHLLHKIKSLSETGIPIANRNDYKQDSIANQKYNFGFDVFFIHRKFINIYPQGMYSMGQTWWDYWIPYIALKNKIPVFRMQESFAFHKEHPKQYKDKDWHRMTDYFKFENDITGTDYQKINDGIFNEIINNSLLV